MKTQKRPTIGFQSMMIIERMARVNGHTVTLFQDLTMPVNSKFNVSIYTWETKSFRLKTDLSSEDANKLFDKFVTELGAQKEPPGSSPNIPGGSRNRNSRPE